MASCSDTPEPVKQQDCCDGEPNKKLPPDRLLWTTLVLATVGYCVDFFAADFIQSWSSLATMAEAIRNLMNSMWVGLALGMFFVGVLGRVPREFVTSLLGKGDTLPGIL